MYAIRSYYEPEYQYNLDLIRHFLGSRGIQPVEPTPPYLSFDTGLLTAVRGDTAARLGVNPAKYWLLVHAGSGGSANNLSLQQYADLILALQAARPDRPCILTAGPGEEVQAHALAKQIQARGGQATVYVSDEGLARFAQVLANAELFIAGSTGPLHLAAARITSYNVCYTKLLRQGEAHLAGTVIAQEAHRIDRLAGRTRGRNNFV